MNYNNIAELFINTTENFASKKLYYSKLGTEWIGITGTDIREEVENLASGLKLLGLEKGDKVAIQSTNNPRWCMTDYSIICSGCTTVTLYPTLIPSQMNYILDNSETRIFFVQNQEQLQKFKGISSSLTLISSVVVMDDSSVDSESHIINYSDLLKKGLEYKKSNSFSITESANSIDENDLLTLIYTSGTTGNPKGVMLTHRNLIANITAILQAAKLSQDDNETFLSFLPLSHILERMGGHFTTFSIGSSVYFAESIETVAENLIETKPTVALCVPRLFEKIYNKIMSGLSEASAMKKKMFFAAIETGKRIKNLPAGSSIPFSLSVKHKIFDKLIYSKVRAKLGGNIRFFISGGAPLPKEIAEFFSYLDILILEGYGLTETSPVLTSNTEDSYRFGTVGKPLHNVEIKIAEDGEILAKGPNIMTGYYKNDEETKESIDVDNWFHTGDIGEFDSDGYLKITDRKKSLIVTSGGKNIAPAPLENAMATSIYIEQVLAIGDKRNFISAIIAPNFEALSLYLSKLDISCGSDEDMSNHPETLKLLHHEVENRMSEFAKYEQVKKIAVLPRLLTIDNGELTPKMSIVRKVVVKNFDELIEKIYSDV